MYLSLIVTIAEFHELETRAGILFRRSPDMSRMVGEGELPFVAWTDSREVLILIESRGERLVGVTSQWTGSAFSLDEHSVSRHGDRMPDEMCGALTRVLVPIERFRNA